MNHWLRRVSSVTVIVLLLTSLLSVPCLGQSVVGEIKSDVVYGHKDGMALTYDVFEPAKNRRGVGILFMVSGGWVSTWMKPEQTAEIFKPLSEQGFTVFAVRHGSSPKYVVPEVVGDVRLALNHIYEHAKEYRVDSAKLGAFGYSAGGHLSLMLGTTANDEHAKDATKPMIAAVVAIFPPTDLNPYVDPKNPLREQFPALKFPVDKANDVSPLMQVSSVDAPTILVHGDKDELVPLWHSQKIKAAFDEAKVPAELVVIEGAGHGFQGAGQKRMVESMLGWFDRYLGPAKP